MVVSQFESVEDQQKPWDRSAFRWWQQVLFLGNLDPDSADLLTEAFAKDDDVNATRLRHRLHPAAARPPSGPPAQIVKGPSRRCT